MNNSKPLFVIRDKHSGVAIYASYCKDKATQYLAATTYISIESQDTPTLTR